MVLREVLSLALPMELYFDSLAAVMCLIVTGVGLLIHIYSIGYMAHDPGIARFFSYMNLFLASMLVLVLGKSLPVIFIGWEGVGLCSYLLIGYWFTNTEYAKAGRKARKEAEPDPWADEHRKEAKRMLGRVGVAGVETATPRRMRCL